MYPYVWETGLSYPDVSLVPTICRLLHISEHEFFTACDDDEASAQARAAVVWNGVVRGFRIFFAVAYLAALVPCFFCNLVFEGRLSWFWIVLFSLGMAFCVTNLPFHLKKNKLPICMGAISGCLLLLLLACRGVTGGPWLGAGMAITAICLALPWSAWAVVRFYGRRLPAALLALVTVWLFVMLAVIDFTTGGGWLLSLGYPIAAFAMALVWLLFVILYWLPAGPLAERWIGCSGGRFCASSGQLPVCPAGTGTEGAHHGSVFFLAGADHPRRRGRLLLDQCAGFCGDAAGRPGAAGSGDRSGAEAASPPPGTVTAHRLREELSRYWMASARCSTPMCSAPSRSAMVRATRRMRS